MSDEAFMDEALALARAAWASGETPVGCVIVDEATGAVIARAANAPISQNDPSAHAEMLAIRAAAAALGNYRLREGLTLYVTLEPCTMCAGAISAARLARVVWGADDPKGGAVVSGVRYFEAPTCHWRPKTTGGVRAEESATLLRGFFRARRQEP
jgi:tRNA(Arg) A34 adenosine deaminase TadA